MSYLRVRVRTALSRSGLPDLDYSLNPYVGCLHGCAYCYARSYTYAKDVAENWGRVIYIKENILEVLDDETKKRKPGVVGVSTVTDPYQPVEAVELLTRRSIELLLRRGFRVSIQTKSPLVLRDLDVLSSHRDRVDVGFTIITMDPEQAALLEPRAPPPKERARALARIAGEGIRTWLFYGPVIPGINDSAESLAEVLEEVGGRVDLVFIDKLRVTKEVERSMRVIIDGFNSVLSLAGRQDWWSRVRGELLAVCEKAGVRCVPSLAEPAERRSRSLADFGSRPPT